MKADKSDGGERVAPLPVNDPCSGRPHQSPDPRVAVTDERGDERIAFAKKVLAETLPAGHKLWKPWALDLADALVSVEADLASLRAERDTALRELREALEPTGDFPTKLEWLAYWLDGMDSILVTAGGEPLGHDVQDDLRRWAREWSEIVAAAGERSIGARQDRRGGVTVQDTRAKIVIDGVDHWPTSAPIQNDVGMWSLECSCLWECWDQEDEGSAWDAFEDHVYDEMRSTINAAVSS